MWRLQVSKYCGRYSLLPPPPSGKRAPLRFFKPPRLCLCVWELQVSIIIYVYPVQRKHVVLFTSCPLHNILGCCNAHPHLKARPHQVELIANIRTRNFLSFHFFFEILLLKLLNEFWKRDSNFLMLRLNLRSIYMKRVQTQAIFLFLYNSFPLLRTLPILTIVPLSCWAISCKAVFTQLCSRSHESLSVRLMWHGPMSTLTFATGIHADLPHIREE